MSKSFSGRSSASLAMHTACVSLLSKKGLISQASATIYRQDYVVHVTLIFFFFSPKSYVLLSLHVHRKACKATLKLYRVSPIHFTVSIWWFLNQPGDFEHPDTVLAFQAGDSNMPPGKHSTNPGFVAELPASRWVTLLNQPQTRCPRQ